MEIPIDHVVSELRSVPGSRVGPKFTFILCPFHSEKTPSGRVSHDPMKRYVGSFKCYGCGRRARWNELAEALGIAKWGTGKDKPVELEVPKTNEAMYHNTLLPSKKVTSRKGTDTFFDLDSYNASKIGLKRNMWRGYHIDFLRDQIGSKIVYSETLTESGDTYGRFYIWLPVHVNRKLKGYIRAQTTKPTNKKFPSYLNAPGSWSLTHGLFPFDPAIRLMKSLGLTTIILVEGPRDALRLIQAGIPAMSMLGTQSWSDQKTRLLEFAGVTRLVLFLDGDEAGKNATRFLTTGYRVKTDTAAAIKPLGDTFELKVLRLWNVEVPPGHPESSLDPGNVPDIYLNKLTRLLT